MHVLKLLLEKDIIEHAQMLLSSSLFRIILLLVQKIALEMIFCALCSLSPIAHVVDLLIALSTLSLSYDAKFFAATKKFRTVGWLPLLIMAHIVRVESKIDTYLLDYKIN